MKAKQTLPLTVVLILGCMVTTGAHAMGDGSRFFSKFDKNDNGEIELDEVYAKKEATFNRLDKNSNGLLEPDELEPKRQRIQERFAGMDIHANLDLDEDGVVSLEEYQSSKNIIDLADTDGSDSVDKAEFKTFIKSRNSR